VLALFTRGRKALFRDELLAAGFAVGFGLLVGKAAGTDWSTSLSSVGGSGPPAVYLAVRLAIATAVVVVASPHMSRPLRFIGRWVVGVGAVAGIALGATLPIGMAAGFLIGVGSAALVHLVFGSPGGRLTPDQVATALGDLGVDVREVHDAPLQPSGVALATASTADGRTLLVKTYGRDAWDGQLLATTWASLWRRGETPHGVGRLELVEHEAFVSLLAERGGVPVLPVVAAGLASGRDALLVTESAGRPFRSFPGDEVGDGLLDSLWRAVAGLHELGIAHGQVDGDRLLIRPDGSAVLSDFGGATVAAPDAAIRSDRAQLLVATALVTGPDRAVAAAAAAIGPEALGEVLPFLQPAVLGRPTRRAVRDRDWDLDDLRGLAAERAGIEPPALEKLRRVTWGSVAIVVLLGFVVYALIAAIADVGLQTLIDELKQADGTWLLAALLLSPVIQVAQTFSTMGASVLPVRFVPVLMLEYAIQFIALAVPSSAARVALEVRFFQRNGAESGAAISIGLIDSVCGFVVQIILILAITLSGLASLDLSSVRSSSGSSSDASSGVGFLGLLVVLLVLAALVTLVVPRYRHMVGEAIPRYRRMLRTQVSASLAALRVLRSPSKVAMVFGGNLTAQVLQAIVLGLCLRAFGQQATLAELILVNTFVSLFAGLMPVPGGMGVAEAGYTAGLAALGVPSADAMSVAITFRLVTFYLPPIWGSIAMRWLRGHAYV
jgi:uncharacterized protein (TIRG00374 family)